MIVPTIAVVLPVMTMLEPVIGPVVSTLQPIVETPMFPAAHVPPVGIIMLPLEPIMIAVMPLFETVVLAIVAMAPAALVRHCGSGHTEGQNGGEGCERKFTHTKKLLHFPCSPLPLPVAD